MKRPRCAHCGRRVTRRRAAMLHRYADGSTTSWHYYRAACRQAWLDTAGRLAA